jgi:hypothetical protein
MDCARVHIVNNCPVWVGEEAANTAQLKVLTPPSESEELTCLPVDQRVGNVKNKDPSRNRTDVGLLLRAEGGRPSHRAIKEEQ